MSSVRRIRVVLLALIAGVAACRSLTSSTTIAPGQAFRLGGEQAKSFLLQGKNAGPVTVVVFAERNGARDSVATVAPGELVDARFPQGSTAIIKNTSSTRTATVELNVTGDIANLGMGYERNAPPRD
jgi:hypothetical protein